jgi:hypothetical protein
MTSPSPTEQIKKIVDWATSHDTGSSSITLCRFMLGLSHEGDYPFDASDRGRCIRLLNLIPEWWDRLDEMASIPARESIVMSTIGFTTVKEGWAKQIPLIKQEKVTIK